jgi:alcohol dehydrogenase YqhD (iron-dependent ADH family)
MLNDVYSNPTKVIFGKGAEDGVGQEVAGYAKKVLLHYGSHSAKKSGLIDRIAKSLKDAGVEAFELGGVQANPRYSLTQEGAGICRKNGIGFIVAVGGGSVIDSAKCIAFSAVNDGDIWQRFFINGEKLERALPLATVLTIPGAGSESSDGCVITHDQTMEKMACGSDILRPVFSILNPELTYTVPAYHTAAGIVDGMAHIFERYFTNSEAVDVTDRMCEGVLRSFMKYAPVVVREPNNYAARAEIMWACKIAHDNTLGIGREQDWGSHMIEHELSAKYDVSHGAGLSVVFPAWMKYVYKKHLSRFVQFAMRVFDVEYRPEDPDWTARQGIKRFMVFCESIGMPVSLRELGITEKTHLDELAKAAAEHSGGSVGNFEKLNAKDIREIYEIAF